MYKHLINNGHANPTDSLQEQLGFIPKYINVTNEKDGKVGKWFIIFVSSLFLQGIIFFTLLFVIDT